jgi:phytoene dehydrogenase-like protein
VTRLFEQAAPGFRDLVLAARVVPAAEMSQHNANYVGGDIIVGGATLKAAMVGPTVRANPFTTPIPRAYLCSSATPPGTGVHGMCGFYAARTVLKREFGIKTVPSLAP